MTLETELARFSALDYGKMSESLSASKESLSAVSGGLSSLLGENEEVMGAVNTCCGALQVLTGLASIGKVAKAVTESRTSVKTAEAGALTAAMSAMGPLGWKRIAVAGAAMVVTSAVLYGTVSTIRLGSFDLSTSSGQSSAVEAVRGAMA